MIKETIHFKGKKYDKSSLRNLINKIDIVAGIDKKSISCSFDYEYKPGFLEMKGDLFRPTGKDVVTGVSLTYSGNCNPSDVYQAITSSGYAIQKTKVQTLDEPNVIKHEFEDYKKINYPLDVKTKIFDITDKDIEKFLEKDWKYGEYITQKNNDGEYKVFNHDIKKSNKKK
jgi:hypothetical protein